MKYDVSVILALYNPDLNKIERTLNSILKQQKINFEIVVTDDGSSEDFFDEISSILDGKGFANYHLTKLAENAGTVSNVLNGLKIATGEYIFLTSPGDVLYSEDTLREFKDKACEKNAAVVFGNAVYYHIDNHNNVCFHEECVQPYWPEQYNELTLSQLQASFYFGNYILGAAVLRERELFHKSLLEISDYCKYVEDNTTTALLLAENIRPFYYKKNFVFYEYGVGISTNKQETWKKILNNDFYHVYEYIKKTFPDNKAVSAKLYSIDNHKSNLDKLKCFLKYPTVASRILLNKFTNKKITNFTENDVKQYSMMTMN